jgi:ubiquinone/menaquinone biosynthesis C-methylase UbiE
MSGVSTKRGRVRALYDRTAERYDRRIRAVDALLFEAGRKWLGAMATGEVLEVGFGTGRNLRHYRPYARVTGLDISQPMLRIASSHAAEMGALVRLVQGDAEALPFAAEQFDTVVFALSLCSIPDEERAIVEARRVLRQGGRILILEHVRSHLLPVRLVQRLLDPLFRRFQADHLLRDPVEHLRRAGLSVAMVDRSRWGIVARAAAQKMMPSSRPGGCQTAPGSGASSRPDPIP